MKDASKSRHGRPFVSSSRLTSPWTVGSRPPGLLEVAEMANADESIGLKGISVTSACAARLRLAMGGWPYSSLAMVSPAAASRGLPQWLKSSRRHGLHHQHQQTRGAVQWTADFRKKAFSSTRGFCSHSYGRGRFCARYRQVPCALDHPPSPSTACSPPFPFGPFPVCAAARARVRDGSEFDAVLRAQRLDADLLPRTGVVSEIPQKRARGRHTTKRGGGRSGPARPAQGRALESRIDLRQSGD